MNDRETEEYYHMMVEDYTPSVYKYFCSCRLSPAEAEDLTQETFLEAWKSLPGFRKESSPKTWLIKISRRIVWKYIKNRSKKQELKTSYDHAPSEREAFYESQERSGEIHLITKTLAALTPEHQEMLHLHHMLGFTEREMAEILSMSQHTIHSRLNKARKRFRALYQEAQHEGD